MALENEYMLEELTAEEIYQKKLTAGANITINNQNVISATGGGSSVQYTSNYAQGDILGTLNIDGASSAIRTPNLVEGENITITRDQQTGAVTISSTGGSGDLSANELTEEAYNALTPAEKTNGDLYLTHPAALESSEPNKIYYNNTLYGTEGGNDVVELTQAEWDALPSSKLTDGIIYVITDSGGGGGASAISDLTDVELTDLADGEILKYDAIAEKWINTVESKGNNGIHIPPVIFDNDNLKKVNDVDGFPGLEKVFLAPSDYEALTQAEKEDLSKIYYVSEYDYYSDKGGTLVLRVKNDEIKLFVNGFVDENTDLEDGNIVGIINDKIRELVGSYFIGSIAYNENKEPIGGSFPYVYIDANYSRIAFRNASGDSSRVINTTTYAVIDLTNYSQGQGSVLQSNPWEDPYDISGGMTIYYGGKQYTEYKIPTPDINAVQVPPVIFDNGSLKKVNNIDGFPGLKKIFLTPTGYEALTQVEKEDLSKIYYVSLYEFFSSNDGTVVIRLNGDKTERLCFFNGFIDNFNSVTPYANFPEELRDVWTTYSNAPENVASTEYDENGDIRSGRYFGLRSASDWHVNDMDGGWNNYGPKNRANYAVIDMTSSTALQSNPWADPYNIPNGMTIYYGGKQYSEYEIPDPLPSVTSSDNGKVLKVVNGDWAAGTDIDVLYGEERPDDENDGKDKDFYLKVKSNSDILAEEDVVLNSTTAHPMALLDFINNEGIYSFTVQGNPSGNGAGETADFPFHNLIEGEKYQATFTVSFDSNTLFKENVPNYAYFCGKYITLVDTTEATTYTTEFTCPTNPFLSLRFYRLRDGVTFNCHITNLTIKSYRIEEIYNKHDKYWRKYIPPQMVGAAETTDGQSGTVPAPTRGSVNYFLKGDGTWGLDTLENLRGVAFSEPLTNGQILKYNARMKCWENASVNDNLILDAQIYSLEEKQVGVWVDGRPLYQKTVIANYNNQTALDVQITPSDGYLIKHEAWLIPSDADRSVQIPTYQNNSATYVTTVEGYALSGLGIRVLRQASGNFGTNPTIYVTGLYTKSSDAVGSGGYQAYGFSPIIYSEEEREVGVWIDGKPLYQKTYAFNTTVRITNSGANISQYIDNRNNIDNIVNGIGHCTLLTYSKSSDALWVGYSTQGAIMSYCAEGTTINHITLWYTKTTDTAGSGSYNTLGVPMTHIDGNEQVVGTLFGETLYQKSYQTTVTIASTARAWYTLVTSSQLRVINADKVLIDATHSFIELNDSIINLNYSSIVNTAGGTAGCSYASTEDEIQVCLYGFVAGTYPATVTIQYTKSTS